MAISPEWMSAVIAALSLGYLIGAGVQRRRDATRNAMPIARADWSAAGTGGFSVKLKLINRLNEDLYVTKAECRSRFVESTLEGYEPGTDKAKFSYVKKPSPMPVRWTISANEEGAESFAIEGVETSRWLRLTVTSSAGTLKNRRIVIEERS